MSNENRCCDSSTWRTPYQQLGRCSRNGVVEYDGKHYCRQHSPEAVAKRDREWLTKHDKKMSDRRIEMAAMGLLASLENSVAMWGHRCTDDPQRAWLEEALGIIAKARGTS